VQRDVNAKRNIFTIGHSTRSTESFIGLLRDNGVEALVDVRTIPRSRHNPQYESDALKRNLRRSGIEYVWMKELGGLRRPRQDSENLGWRNASFRGFADYMQTEDFDNALGKLIRVASEKPTCVMCAEAVPWRCHRSLIADSLSVRGFDVLHIIGAGQPRQHILTRFAVARGGKVSYPQPEDEREI